MMKFLNLKNTPKTLKSLILYTHTRVSIAKPDFAFYAKSQSGRTTPSLSSSGLSRGSALRGFNIPCHAQYAQSGRTILETIVALAVMCLLSFAGVKGFKMLRSKATAQNTAKMIATVVAEHRTGLMRADLTTDNAVEEVIQAPHGSLTLKRGNAGNRGKYFWITANGSDKAFCKELIQSPLLGTDIITFDGDLDGSCPAEFLSFYFPKNPDDSTPLTYTDKDGETRLCPEGAICFGTGSGGNGTDKSPENTTEPENPEEIEEPEETPIDFICVSGYWRNEDECLKCPQHSASCTSDGFTCPDNYVQTNTDCIYCGSPIKECDEKGQPIECEDGYYLNDNSCKPCEDEGVLKCEASKALLCSVGYFLDGEKCYPCPEKYKTCDNNGLMCVETYIQEGSTCLCPEGTFDNGEKCTSDCWDQNMSISDIIRPSTQYFSRCNKLCGEGLFYAYNNRNGTSCERGPIAEGACQNLPNIREKRYSASDDAKAAKFLGLLDDNGDPILLGEEEALRLTQNMVWYDGITHYYNSASICDAVGMHLASIDDIGCDERGSSSRCKKNGVGSKIVQALASVYLHGSGGNIPSFISGTRNGCTPAHIWLNQAELNYDSRTSFDISKQTAGASTLCVK